MMFNDNTPNQKKRPSYFEQINEMAAGIDIGSKSHFVAVPEGAADANPAPYVIIKIVRYFKL